MVMFACSSQEPIGSDREWLKNEPIEYDRERLKKKKKNTAY